MFNDKKRLVCGQREKVGGEVYRSEFDAAVIPPRLSHQLTEHQMIQVVAPALRSKSKI